jgi:hypothetical protein
VGSGRRSGLQAGDPLQSFIRNNGAAQMQESRQRQHDRQKAGAGRDSVKRMILSALVLSCLLELMRAEEGVALRIGVIS